MAKDNMAKDEFVTKPVSKVPSAGNTEVQEGAGAQAAPSRTDASEQTPEEAEASPSSEASPSAGAEGAAGRHWLKYAGIGAARTQKDPRAKATPMEVTSLGSLEAELMGILWEIGAPATGMEVMETTLYKRRAHGLEPPSFSSIDTTLRRLTNKGLLETQKNEARTPTYWPKVEREQMAARILNNVSRTLLGSSLHALLPKLIGRAPSQAISSAEEENVQRLMEALERVAEADRPPSVPADGSAE